MDYVNYLFYIKVKCIKNYKSKKSYIMGDGGAMDDKI